MGERGGLSTDNHFFSIEAGKVDENMAILL